jgi:hypothetical protein
VPLLSPFPLALSPLPEFDVELLDSFGILFDWDVFDWDVFDWDVFDWEWKRATL